MYRPQWSPTLGFQSWVHRTVPHGCDPAEQSKSGPLTPTVGRTSALPADPDDFSSGRSQCGQPVRPDNQDEYATHARTLGPSCVRKVATATIVLATPDEHYTAIDQATTVGAGDLHAPIMSDLEREQLARAPENLRPNDGSERPGNASRSTRSCAPNVVLFPTRHSQQRRAHKPAVDRLADSILGC